jgi:hypothetical protein
MNDNGERKTLRAQYSRPTAWREGQAPIVTFWVDPGHLECIGFPFFAMAAARYLALEETAALEWPFGTILVKGPKAIEFFEAFCCHQVAEVKADGQEIISVVFRSVEQPDGGIT